MGIMNKEYNRLINFRLSSKHWDYTLPQLLPSWPGGPRFYNTAVYNPHYLLLCQRLYKASFVKADTR
jgi:hypothetical protein